MRATFCAPKHDKMLKGVICRHVTLTVRRVDELDATERDALFALLKSNVEVLYRSSKEGWDDAREQGELFPETARFLVARCAETGNLAGYSMFTFKRRTDFDASDAEDGWHSPQMGILDW